MELQIVFNLLVLIPVVCTAFCQGVMLAACILNSEKIPELI